MDQFCSGYSLHGVVRDGNRDEFVPWETTVLGGGEQFDVRRAMQPGEQDVFKSSVHVW